MTRQEHIDGILKVYRMVKVLADKNGCRALHLRHKQLGRDMVLHSFPESIRGYEVLCGYRHENLPLVYDVIDLDDGQIVLEEYIDGLTVAQVLETGLYRYKGAKKVISDLCEGLSFLHERGIVHRDIKPENVVIDKNGRVVLIDLNASRQLKPAGKDTVVMGTVGYASPEQLGIAQSDQRTDIYSMGIMLNVMLTGKHPCEGIAKGRPGSIINKCTNIDPEQRYGSVKELQYAL